MGKIKVTECGGIKGLKVVEPTVFGDARGYFMETYNYKKNSSRTSLCPLRIRRPSMNRMSPPFL